jgi:glucosyl-dolichyl phosphate glucuronosyltransferase
MITPSNSKVWGCGLNSYARLDSNNEINLSIIIPTYNRAQDLGECLDSIRGQTRKPQEIIIVDDSDNEDTFNLVTSRIEDFKNKKMTLKFIKNEKERSSAIARNQGLTVASGNIILFLDDDVILHNDYIEHILELYERIDNCLGVQGHIILKDKLNKFQNFLNRSIFYNYAEKNACRVLPSTCITYPYILDKIISCSWLAGSNQSYRRYVLDEFKFDENFKRYSWREDVDLSYRIHKKYKESLYITPYSKVIHKSSNKARMPERSLTYMKEVYSLYVFFKDIDQSWKNKFIYIWSKLGFMLQILAMLMLNPFKNTKSKQLKLKYLFEAYMICLNHIEEIKNGNLDFLKQEFV